MTTTELKAEFEKRIDTLSVFVDRLNMSMNPIQPVIMRDDEPDDESTVYRVRVGYQNSYAERRISAFDLSQRNDLAGMIDSFVLYLVYDWARERYVRKVKS